MSIDVENMDVAEITDDDRLWAALAWLPIIWPLIAIIVLLLEDKKNRPFIRYNAILALITGVVGVVLSALCVGVLVFVLMFYYMVLAYQGQVVTVPFVTDFAKKQGWI